MYMHKNGYSAYPKTQENSSPQIQNSLMTHKPHFQKNVLLWKNNDPKTLHALVAGAELVQHSRARNITPCTFAIGVL